MIVTIICILFIESLNKLQNKSLDSTSNRSPDVSNTNQEYKSATPNSPKSTSYFKTPPHREKTDHNIRFQNQPTGNASILLDLQLQIIEDPITVKLGG